MKKILTLVCAMVLGLGFAQGQVHQGQTAVGANLVYGSEIESLGLGARFQYGILDQAVLVQVHGSSPSPGKDPPGFV